MKIRSLWLEMDIGYYNDITAFPNDWIFKKKTEKSLWRSFCKFIRVILLILIETAVAPSCSKLYT